MHDNDNTSLFPLRYAWRLTGLYGLSGSPVYGRACRILARGAMNSRLVEFEDGERHIVSGNALRNRYACRP
jgi:hypothetical protein